MTPGVKNVSPASEYKLVLTFDNDEKKIFDMKPYLDKGIFRELNDVKIFNGVYVSFDSIEWPNGADICPEVLYKHSVNT
jgi:hypothetical protein